VEVHGDAGRTLIVLVASPHNPPFRADHVGSLRRPQALVDARSRYRKKEIGKDELGKAEDDAIRGVVALQESIGLKSITDGEFRRQNYIIDFYFKAFGRDGIGFEQGQFYHRNDKGEKLPAERMVVKAKAKWSGPIFAEHFSFLKSVTKATAKITVPSPLILHFLGGNDAVLRGAYTALDAFWSDLIDVYSKELAALHAAGCRYLQIDETSLVKFGDPEIRAVLEERGDDWQKLAASYVEVLNAILAKVPAGLNVGMHVCRGNRLGFWQADTGYEFMAEQIFKKLNVGFYLLEFDSARAGPLDALRLMPDGKTAVLGLITTKSPELEDREALRQRVMEAAKHIPLDRLCLSPQCGFSGDVRNAVMTIEQQVAKLRLLVETARSIWDDAR
jgi:5-methyltetrahydropteroyltriglutamate--homocysteine methyltransferase